MVMSNIYCRLNLRDFKSHHLPFDHLALGLSANSAPLGHGKSNAQQQDTGCEML